MPDDPLNSIPASLLGLLGSWLGALNLFKWPLLIELLLFSQVALFAALSDGLV